jgi:hypothetical protein
MTRLLPALALLCGSYCFCQPVIIIHGVKCDVHGTAIKGSKEYSLNVLKNRYVFPKPSDIDSTLTLQDLAAGSTSTDFPQNKAVVITAYVYNVKRGGTESCNCKTPDPVFRDTHIELTPDENDTSAASRVIVEVSPRIRVLKKATGTNWTTDALYKTIRKHVVRITGWLFYDREHESGAFANDPDDTKTPANWRASCWEIHPVTEIEIID